MRLVDREQAQPAAGVQVVEHGEEALGEQPLRRDVEQIEPTLDRGALHGARLLGPQAAVEVRRAHAQQLERRDLVLHQRDERRHDDGHAR